MALVERDGFTVFEDKNLEECSHGIAPKEDCYYCLEQKKKDKLKEEEKEKEKQSDE